MEEIVLKINSGEMITHCFGVPVRFYRKKIEFEFEIYYVLQDTPPEVQFCRNEPEDDNHLKPFVNYYINFNEKAPYNLQSYINYGELFHENGIQSLYFCGEHNRKLNMVIPKDCFDFMNVTWRSYEDEDMEAMEANENEDMEAMEMECIYFHVVGPHLFT